MKATRIMTIVVLSLALLLAVQVALAGETAFQAETRAKLEKIEQDVARLKKMLEKAESMPAAQKTRFDEHFIRVGTELVEIEEYIKGAGGGG